MKNNQLTFPLQVILFAACFLLILGFGIATGLHLSYRSKLEAQIALKDKQLARALASDSLTNLQAKQYSDRLNKYINNGTLKIDNKTVTNEELITIFNDLVKRNVNLNDSLEGAEFAISVLKEGERDQADLLSKYYRSADSLRMMQVVYSLIRDHYGINVAITKNKNVNTFSIDGFSKADSGLLLLDRYREALHYDSAGYWTIERWPKPKR